MAFMLKSGGLYAKIKAMKGRLLKYDDYYGLAQSGNVNEVAYKLREWRDYEEIVDTSSNEIIHRGFFEERLLISSANNFTRIYKFIDERSLRKYLDVYILKDEFLLIKLLLSTILDPIDDDISIPQLEGLLDKRVNFNPNELINLKSVDELAEGLKGSSFHNVLRHSPEKGESFFDIEMKLDLHYYTRVLALIAEHLNKTDKKIAGKLMGIEIDIRNLLLIYRLKTYYDVSETDIYSYLVPSSYLLKREELAEIIGTRNKEETLRRIRETKYGEIFESTDDIMLNSLKYLDKVYSRTAIQNFGAFSEMLAYFFKKDLEIKNITSLIEGVRYGLDPKEIMEYVVL